MYGSALARTYYGAGDYQRRSTILQLVASRRGVRAAPPRRRILSRAASLATVRRFGGYGMTRGVYQAGGFWDSVKNIGKTVFKAATPMLKSIPGVSTAFSVFEQAKSIAGSLGLTKKSVKPVPPLLQAAFPTAQALQDVGKDLLLPDAPGGKRRKRRTTRRRAAPRRARSRSRRAAPRRRGATRRARGYYRRGDPRTDSGQWKSPGFAAGPYPHRGHRHYRDVAPEYSTRRRKRRASSRRRRRAGRVSFTTKDGRKVSFNVEGSGRKRTGATGRW